VNQSHPSAHANIFKTQSEPFFKTQGCFQKGAWWKERTVSRKQVWAGMDRNSCRHLDIWRKVDTQSQSPSLRSRHAICCAPDIVPAARQRSKRLRSEHEWHKWNSHGR